MKKFTESKATQTVAASVLGLAIIAPSVSSGHGSAQTYVANRSVAAIIRPSIWPDHGCIGKYVADLLGALTAVGQDSPRISQTPETSPAVV